MVEESILNVFCPGNFRGFYFALFLKKFYHREKEKKMKELLSQAADNVIFLLQFFGVIALMFLIAYVSEKIAGRRQGERKIFTVRKIAMVGVFSAIAAVLMLIEIPMPFAPSFYKLDLSELPALICSFAMGPVAGVMVEFCKIILKLLIKGTTTAFVGELANFTVGCAFILPTAVMYCFKKTKKTAIIGCVVGTVVLTVFGSAFNGIYLLPKFAQIYGMDLDAIIAMGTAINPAITSVSTFVVFAVAPLNLIKGVVDSAITILIYKKISVLIHRVLDNQQ